MIVAEDSIDDPDMAGYAEANRDEIYKMLTGADPGDLAEMVRALGGPKAVAPLVNRSERTVQRWITTKPGAQKITAPKADALEALKTAAEQNRNTREGRQRIADTRRATLLRSGGAKMSGTAYSGVLSAGGSRAYLKDRHFEDYTLGSDIMDKTLDAFIEGGDDAAFGAFNTAFGDDYGQGGAFFDEWLFADLSGLDFTLGTGDE